MKYKYSNGERTQIDENGKREVFAICDACGKEHKNNYGFMLSYSMPGGSVSIRKKYCRKCAAVFIPEYININACTASFETQGF